MEDENKHDDDEEQVDPQALIDLFRSKGTKVTMLGPGAHSFGVSKGSDGKMRLGEMSQSNGRCSRSVRRGGTSGRSSGRGRKK